MIPIHKAIQNLFPHAQIIVDKYQLSTGYSSLPIVGMGTKPLGEIRPQMFSVKSEGRGITKDTVKVTPDFGRKMDYVFGNATGNKHNIDRSIVMERQLNSIGIFDNKTGRKHVLDNLTDTFNDASSILKTQDNGRIVRDSLLTGPNGVLKVESIWDGEKLITIKLFGGK